jgi:hypothetical protein
MLPFNPLCPTEIATAFFEWPRNDRKLYFLFRQSSDAVGLTFWTNALLHALLRIRSIFIFKTAVETF